MPSEFINDASSIPYGHMDEHIKHIWPIVGWQPKSSERHIGLGKSLQLKYLSEGVQVIYIWLELPKNPNISSLLWVMDVPIDISYIWFDLMIVI